MQINQICNFLREYDSEDAANDLMRAHTNGEVRRLANDSEGECYAFIAPDPAVDGEFVVQTVVVTSDGEAWLDAVTATEGPHEHCTEFLADMQGEEV